MLFYLQEDIEGKNNKGLFNERAYEEIVGLDESNPLLNFTLGMVF